jgi:glycosyltransferase involved in cell wall biosynthesis
LVWRTASLVRRLDIDIVHAHEVKSDVISYLASFLVRTRLMTTLHGWIGNSPKQRLFTALDKRVVGRFDRVIVVSALMRDEMAAAGVGNGHLRLVHNGIVLNRYRRTGTKLLSDLIGQPLSGPVLSSIGRLSLEKGHADLIDAVAIVRSRGHRVSVILVGDGPERGRLLDRIRERQLEGTVHLPGYLDQPQRVLEETDLAVLPSHTEGLPNAALEAMAMGVPVLATRVGGTPEVITDGITGRLVPARSPAALAEAIEDFICRPAPWASMAGAARDVVEREFDFAARTRRMEDIYTELLDEATAR